MNETGAVESANGIMSKATAAVTNPTTGPARKIQVVVVLKTEPFEPA